MNTASKVLVIAVFAAFAASAQVYKYIDKDGKVQYTDQPPQDAKKSEVKVDKPAEARERKEDWRGREKDLDAKLIEKRRLRDACIRAKENLRQWRQVLEEDKSRNTRRYYNGRLITPELVDEARVQVRDFCAE